VVGQPKVGLRGERVSSIVQFPPFNSGNFGTNLPTEKGGNQNAVGFLREC